MQGEHHEQSEERAYTCAPACKFTRGDMRYVAQGTGVNLLAVVPGPEESKRPAVTSDPQVD